MKSDLQQKARELGFDDCRVTSADAPESASRLLHWLEQGHHGQMTYLARNAQKRVDPQKVLPGAKSIITLAASYHHSSNRPSGAGASRDLGFNEKLAPPKTRPHASPTGMIARYAQFDDYHEVLARSLKALTDWLKTWSGPEVECLWYVDTGPLLERDLAQRAGLGFVGKHTNLISRRLGNWIFLAEIITTIPLEPDMPEKNHCGSCVRCLRACPTQAITAPFQLDARRCISYLTIELKGEIPLEFRPAIGSRIFGCDDCLEVCPWNRFAREGHLMKAGGRGDLNQPGLLELMGLDEAEFRRRFGATPLSRTKRRGLLRNVSVALGNVGDAGALPALEKAVREEEPLIAEHARWAVAEIERRCAERS